MTNLERLQKMNSEDFANELYFSYISDCCRCPCDSYNYKECYTGKTDCVNLIKKWLESKSN